MFAICVCVKEINMWKHGDSKSILCFAMCVCVQECVCAEIRQIFDCGPEHCRHSLHRMNACARDALLNVKAKPLCACACLCVHICDFQGVD